MFNNPWNDWIIDGKIGKGSFATVYKAYKIVDGIKLYCAIKHIHYEKNDKTINELINTGIIKNKEEINSYFEELNDNIYFEYQTLKQFKDSPYIIDCYDYKDITDNKEKIHDIYIKLELATCINDITKEEFTPKEVIKLGMEICQALILCHENNIIHRDIKLSNIYKGIDNFYKIGDFGSIADKYTPKDIIVGSYSYMAPEIYRKEEVTSKTDIYSLGIVLYKLLSGFIPFLDKNNDNEKDIKEAIKKRLSGKKIEEIPGIDDNLMQVILKACAYDPNDRYNTAKELQEDLNKVYINSFAGNTNNKKVINNDVEKTISVYASENIKMSDDNSNIVQKIKNNNLINNITNFLKNNKISDTIIVNNNEKKTPLLLTIKGIFFKYLKIIITILVIILIIFLGYKKFFSNKECKTGFVNYNGRCVKGEYTCKNGYFLNKDNKCAKITKSIEAIPSYTCPEGYINNANTCIKNDVVEPTMDYYCSIEGFTVSNNKCVKTVSIDAIPSYSCPSNSYTLDGNTCVNYSNSTNANFTCPAGYSQNGNYCSKIISDNSLVVTTNNYSCNSGWTYSNGKCIKDASSGYSYGTSCLTNRPIIWNGKRCSYCNEGTLNSSTNKCETNASISGKTSSCSDSSYRYENGTCKKTVTADGTYSCPANKKLVNGKCYDNAIADTVKYSCIEGKLNGKKCNSTIEMEATPTLKCPDNYTNTGTLCVFNDEKAATIKYSCIKSYTLNGARCEQYELIKPEVKLDEKK